MSIAYNPAGRFEIKVWDVEFRRAPKRTLMARVYQPQGSGPFRLAIHHAAGSITEHFDSVTGALVRQGQLETLLVGTHGSKSFDVKPRLVEKL